MSGFALSFLTPWVLAGLLALPVIWWLLRLTPPRPKEELFPPTAILEEIAKKEETPAQSPWWLTLLRLLMAALVIFGMAGPIWNAQESSLSGSGPLLIVMDDAWTSGASWEDRVINASQLLDEAEQSDRPVALAFTSDGGKADINGTLAETARTRLAAASPKPVRSDLTELATKLRQSSASFETLAWLGSGLSVPGTKEFAEAVAAKDITETHYFEPSVRDVHVLTKVANTPDALTVQVERVGTTGETAGQLTAYDIQGRSISTATYVVEDGKAGTEGKFVLPVELRNEITRIEIDGASQAGAIQLPDERFRRRRVGLISGGKADQAQPLLSPLYYISRALEPFSEIQAAREADVRKAVPELIDAKISTMVLADIGTLPEESKEQLEDWVQSGGMLVRFAGPRLASAQDDTLVPVELRRGGRSLGGTLTWGTPQPLASFEQSSPFNGIPVPQDVSVARQVLAEPGIDLNDKTWASLKDGTPLVTASKRGAGWIVLFHVTADAGWSNLPLSGTFVDMLRRIVAVSSGAVAADKARTGATEETETSMPPLKALNGFGKLLPPDSTVRPLKLGTGGLAVSLENPPGTYGTADAFIALNLFDGPANLTPIDAAILPPGTQMRGYVAEEATDLKAWFIGLALLLLALDCLAVLWMAGALRRFSRPAMASLIGFLAYSMTIGDTFAQDSSVDFENTFRTRLAYVKTGDASLDRLSRKGLTGLTQFIASRTSLEPGEPVGVDLETDELAFYPLLYWPISASASLPNEQAMSKLDAFMKKGGSVLFDTRDQLSGGFGSSRVTAETRRLREILSTLDIPPLEPVPENHVLTRAFYLLNVFPGRYLDGRLWVETSETDNATTDRPTRAGDGVSSIMITSNDMAGAWAVETDGSPSLPIVPPNPNQRVYSYRTGANIVMYTLTGNYKSDQVHIPALLERLGQ